MILRLFALSLFLALPAYFPVDVAAQTAPDPAVRYDADYPAPEFHRDRRAAVMERLPDDAVAVFFSAPERRRQHNTHYPYRQDSDLYYLTGTTEPNSVLVLAPGGVEIEGRRYREVLFVPPRTAYSDVWLGRRFGVERAERELGIEKAVNNDRFRETMAAVAGRGNIRFHHPPLPNGVQRGSTLAEQLAAFNHVARPIDGRIEEELFPLVMFALGARAEDDFERRRSSTERQRTRFEEGDGFGAEILRRFTSAADFEAWQSWRSEHVDAPFADGSTLRTILAELRMIKQDEELRLLRRAIDITMEAHREAARTMTPGMHEYEVQAVIEYVFMKEGAEGPGFATIVGSGENSVILHYSANRRQMESGDVVVVDIGAEYRGYTADITRTYPVNGTFSDEQRAIYQLVLDAQEAAIEAARAGNAFSAPGHAATLVIGAGLQELGLIERAEDVRRFFMHGTSHYLGLFVHDVGDFGALQPGQVITVEPGIYISPADDVDPRWWNIGVRIEDDVLITDNDPVVLSNDLPKAVDEVEQMMR